MALHDKTEDLNNFFKSFDKNGDGTISKDELKSIFASFGEKEIDAMIKAVDKNGDGVINYNEFSKWIMGNGGVTDMMFQMGESVTSQDASVDAAIKEMFETVDLDKSGAITLDESLTMAKLVAEKFGQPYDEAQVKGMFVQGDLNKDGKVTLHEFIAYFKKNMQGVPNEVIFATIKMMSEMFKESKKGSGCCNGSISDASHKQQKITVKVTSFNVLGLGFCALPGPEHQWSHFDTLFDELLERRCPMSDEVSILGLQEDVFVLKNGAKWDDHTTRNTHMNFERISFMTSKMESHGFSLVSFSVHDGLSTSSHMLIKDSDSQLAALTDARHRGLFTEVNEKGKKSTSSQQIKLGNSIWVKKGNNLDTLSWRGDYDTFDTWEEAAKLGRIEYNMVPSRSAAKVIFQKQESDGRLRDELVAATCHLAGGKFDDRWLLTGDALTGINGEMLSAFVNNCGNLPSVLFGDTNMKHHDFVDSGMYDSVISNMLFGTKELSQITKLSAAYEGHRKYLLRIGDGEKVTEAEVKSLREAGKSLEDIAKVYDIELSGQPGKIDQEAVKTLIRRAKALWRMDEVADMQLLAPPTKESSSCLFGGVIDHILYKGMEAVDRSYCIDEANVKAMVPQSPETKNIFDRIKASDHFPVMADFALLV